MRQRKDSFRSYYDKLQEAYKTFDSRDSTILGPLDKNQSDHYQWKYKEHTGYSEEFMEDLVNKTAEPDDKSDEYFELIEKLYIEVIRVMKEKLTVIQRMQLKLRFEDGLTVKEVGQTFGTTQSSSYKVIYGRYLDKVRITKKGNRVYPYLGALAKIQKACLADEKVVSILNQLDALKHQI